MKPRLSLLVLSLTFAGCQTHTTTQKVADKIWWVCDGDGSGGCGPNPEKGLNQTCFKDNNAITRYTKLKDGALVVYCR